MNAVRRAFVKAVRFTSAGIGNPGTLTIRAMRDLEEADVVLADELSGVSGEGRDVEWVDVGKRCGAHTKSQPEIVQMICDEVRKGKRVVRLKGGDAGLFGRLSEEVDALDALDIPYVVRPGVSALTAATTSNGLLLTKRGEASGFMASTPRSSGPKTPQVFFMATRMASKMLRRMRWCGMRAAPMSVSRPVCAAGLVLEMIRFRGFSLSALRERRSNAERFWLRVQMQSCREQCACLKTRACLQLNGR